MKLSTLTTIAAVLAAAAVLATAARAQTPVSFTDGDLLIGFEQKGNSTDYVANLGLATQFINASTGTLTFQLSTTDLGNAFGNTVSDEWYTNNTGTLSSTNVQWGVVGNDQNDSLASDPDGNTVFLTLGESSPPTKSTAPVAESSYNLGPITDEIQNFETGAGGFKGTESTSDAINAITENTGSDSNAWGKFGPGVYSPANADEAFGYGSSIEQPTTGSFTGPTDSVLDLYQLNSSDQVAFPSDSVELLGTLKLSSGGVLTFVGADAAAVPEPSTYALVLAGGIMLFFVLKRRKSLPTAT